MKLYGISGLGADKRVFDYLTLNCELVPIQWIDPSHGETIKDYAIRLSQLIDKEEEFGIIGVSFGGLIAVEISKELNPKLTILISSVETKTELRMIYRIIGKSQPLRIIPQGFFVPPRFLSNWLFGTKKKKLLSQILDDTDPKFAKWAVNELVNWKNLEPLSNRTLKIIGTKDKLMPPRKGNNLRLIKSGGHFMIVDKADEISQIINEEILSPLV